MIAQLKTVVLIKEAIKLALSLALSNKTDEFQKKVLFLAILSL